MMNIDAVNTCFELRKRDEIDYDYNFYMSTHKSEFLCSATFLDEIYLFSKDRKVFKSIKMSDTDIYDYFSDKDMSMFNLG